MADEEKPSASPAASEQIKTKRPRPTAPQRNRLEQLIKLVINTARAKGWEAELDSQDMTTYRYASVAVLRYPPNTSDKVSAIFEITCGETVKISPHKTSFHGYALDDLCEAVGVEFRKLPWLPRKSPQPTSTSSGGERQVKDDLLLLERVLRRFHRFARRLRNRREGRTEFAVKDEYDVQDLLHAILTSLFDDVRAEEHTPSYAGGSSRMDFLLKAERIVVEVKFASVSLRDKQIGEELLADIQRYQAHPDCKQLICFVYDPSGSLKNPPGLENDLTGKHGNLSVKAVVVSP